jgi:hypothetical protein
MTEMKERLRKLTSDLMLIQPQQPRTRCAGRLPRLKALGLAAKTDRLGNLLHYRAAQNAV